MIAVRRAVRRAVSECGEVEASECSEEGGA